MFALESCDAWWSGKRRLGNFVKFEEGEQKAVRLCFGGLQQPCHAKKCMKQKLVFEAVGPAVKLKIDVMVASSPGAVLIVFLRIDWSMWQLASTEVAFVSLMQGYPIWKIHQLRRIEIMRISIKITDKEKDFRG